MNTEEHLEKWFGLPVIEADPETDFDPAHHIYRIGYSDDSEESPLPLLERFLKAPGVEKSVALVLGMDAESGGSENGSLFLPLLEQHKHKLGGLRGLFLGDVTDEECMISWLNQDDITRALVIFPGLEELRSRGQSGLQFSTCRHIGLTKLVIETSGMPEEVLHNLASSVLPELQHLELWLGAGRYGVSLTMDDIAPLLNPALFPKLKHLALGNSDLQNEIAEAVAEAPILDQLETLDLSLGVMTDQGAEPLLNSAGVKKLKKLNLRRNFLSEKLTRRFRKLGIEVDVKDQEDPDEEDELYVGVAE